MKRLVVAVVAILFLASLPLEGFAKSSPSSGGSSRSSSSSGSSRSSGSFSAGSSSSSSTGSSGGSKTYGNSGGSSYGSSSSSAAPSAPKGSTFSGGAPVAPPPSNRSASPAYGNSAGTVPDGGSGGRPAAGYGNSAGAPGSTAYGNSSGGQGAAGSSAYGNSAGAASAAGGQKAGGFSGGPPPKITSKAALEDYKSRFAKPSAAPKADSATASAYRREIPSGQDPYAARNVFYERQHWSPPPYMYQSSPSFGIFDAMMLWFILDHLTEPRYAQMAYHMSDDPGFRQWREEAGRLSGENAELRQKVEQLDARMKEYEGQGVKKEPGFVPEGVSPAVVVAPEAVAAPADGSSGAWRWLALAALLATALIVISRRRRRA